MFKSCCGGANEVHRDLELKLTCHDEQVSGRKIFEREYVQNDVTGKWCLFLYTLLSHFIQCS